MEQNEFSGKMKRGTVRNWDDLRLFLAVARAQSLSGAGRDLRLDPATLGRRVARLEAEMGKALFEKSPQGYILTGAGAQLAERLEVVEQALRQATTGVQDDGDQLRGQIRVGAPDGCANFVLPQVCTRIAKAHPELDLQIVALPRVFNLSRREADLAIGVSAPTGGQLRVEKITDYHLHLAASEGYLATHVVPDTIEALQGHRMIGYIPDMIFDRELDYLADLGVRRVPFASNSVSVQLNMLRQGAGIGVVHDFSLPSAPDLQRVLVDEVALKRSFYLIAQADDMRDAQLARFARILRQEVAAEVKRLEVLA